MHIYSVSYDYVVLQLYEIYFTKLFYSIILTNIFSKKHVIVKFIKNLKKKLEESIIYINNILETARMLLYKYFQKSIKYFKRKI